MRDLAKMFGDKPDRFVGVHPIKMVEARKVHWTRVAAQRPLESEVEINIEIAHRQFAQRPIDRLAIATTGEVGFRDRAPMSAHFENCDDMVGVLFRFQIEDERGKTKNAKCGRRKNSAFETRRRAIMQNMFWRARGVTKIVGQLVQKPLHPGRGFQCAEFAQL